MKKIVVDFSNAKTVWEVHECFIEPFKLETNCGMYEGYKYARNFHALWDLLYLLYDEPITIELVGLETLNKDLANTKQKALDFFADLEKKDENVTVMITEKS